ncbi:MAG TPA: extensin family protein [Sphingomonas sp.]|nr:extensin family protein [Sphingomonas sp.]
MLRRVWPALLLLLLPGACAGGGDDERPARTKAIKSTLTRPTPRETQQCFTELSRQNIRFSPLADREFDGGCFMAGTVELIDIGVPVTNLKGMRCGLAQAFTGWVRYAVAPAAAQILGSELARVESFGTYSCRAVIGNASAARLSEHAAANAVDISGFVLADGRRITIERDWRAQDPAVRAFLSVIRQSACRRFKTVLTPDYNAAHYNHLHFDMGGRPLCA